jgi:hypothetical protein
VVRAGRERQGAGARTARRRETPRGRAARREATAPTASRARPGEPGRRGGPPRRTCGAPRSSGRPHGPCTRRPRADRDRTIAERYAVSLLRKKKVRERYEAELGDDEDADDHELRTPSGEQRDPVDAGRQLEVAAELFREGRMPEHGVDILEGVACDCTYKEVGDDLKLSARAVEGRIGTMRQLFKQRIVQRRMR